MAVNFPSVEEMLSASKDELQKHLENVKEAVAEKDRRDKEAIAAKLRALASSAGYQVSDLLPELGVVAAAPTDGEPQPKFRDPGNPENVWGGRGKRPHWLKEYLAKGRKLDEFLVRKG